MKKQFINTDTILNEPLVVTNKGHSEFFMIEQQIFDKANSRDTLEFYILEKKEIDNQTTYSIKEPFETVNRTKGLLSGVLAK